MQITREWLQEHRACYLDEDATESQRALLDRLPDEGVTLAAVLRCEDIPVLDRIWVATRSWMQEHGDCYLDDDATDDDATEIQRAMLARLTDEGVELAEVLRCEDIPVLDRIWVATRPGALPVETIRRWLGDLVDRALSRVGSPDPRSLAVVPYLQRGEAVPADVRCDASYVVYYASAHAASARAARAASDYDAATAATAAAYSTASASSERRAQLNWLQREIHE